MPDQIDWEWDVEEYDEETTENGEVFRDIIDHHFQESYFDCLEFLKQCEEVDIDKYTIVLVQSTWNESEGVIDRSWAYMTADGKLPDFTSTPDSEGSYSNKYRKVPQKFHREVERG